MKRTISFGKVDGYGKGRKVCEVTLEVELREDERQRPVFSVCGSVWNSRHTDIIQGGQCVDDVFYEYGKQLEHLKLYAEIMELWKKYHLNSMHAGTVEQEEAIEEWKAKGNEYDYDKVCDYLKEIGLYEVEYESKPYKYGHAWLYRAIPEADLNRIKEIIL